MEIYDETASFITDCAHFHPGFIFLRTEASSNRCSHQNCTVTAATATLKTTTTPEWFDIKLTDVQTGKTFTMNDYAGKVVLVETMATWCPTCILQASYIYKLHDLLGHPNDLVSVSLDVDLNEDATMLNEYIAQYGFDWHFVVAPIEVDRALGNLYSAEYLNPPLAPMLIIDRNGNVHQLKYGLKDTETLQKAVGPYLQKQ